jgi:hypothetical protein
LFSLIAGNKTKMLLIIFLGLIAKLALVCSGCDVGTTEVTNFNFPLVGICVLTRYITRAAVNNAAKVHI